MDRGRAHSAGSACEGPSVLGAPRATPGLHLGSPGAARGRLRYARLSRSPNLSWWSEAVLAGDPRPHSRAGSCMDIPSESGMCHGPARGTSRSTQRIVRAVRAQRHRVTLYRARYRRALASSASAVLPATRRPRPQRARFQCLQKPFRPIWLCRASCKL